MRAQVPPKTSSISSKVRPNAFSRRFEMFRHDGVDAGPPILASGPFDDAAEVVSWLRYHRHRPSKRASGGAGVMDGVPGIAVAEIILDQTQIVSFVRQREAAGMTQRVGVDVRKTGALRRRRDEVVHPLASQRLIALGNEQPRQRVGARRKVTFDGAQL